MKKKTITNKFEFNFVDEDGNISHKEIRYEYVDKSKRISQRYIVNGSIKNEKPDNFNLYPFALPEILIGWSIETIVIS